MRDVLVGALASELKVDVVETTHRGHARELGAQAAADGIDLVVAVGGDGTVNEVVNGLLENGPAPHLPTLAVVPGGSTNVFSRALGRSRDPVEATAEILDSVRAGRTRLVSLGTASASGTDDADDGGLDDARAGSSSPPASASTPRSSPGSRRSGREGRRSTGALYVREATSAFLLGRERRRPAMTLQVPGEPPLEDLFLCLVSNVSPWTYLGARPVNPSPRGVVRRRARRLRDGPDGPAADAAHAAPDAGPHARRPRARRAPPARPRGAVADRRPARRAGRSTATTWAPRPACACGTCRPRSASSPERPLTLVTHAGMLVNVPRRRVVPSSGGPSTGVVSLLTGGRTTASICLTGVLHVKTSRENATCR